jgi:hypothetical protein
MKTIFYFYYHWDNGIINNETVRYRLSEFSVYGAAYAAREADI